MRSIPSVVRRCLAPLAASLLLPAGAAHAQMLTGWATMPAATFSDGPTSGQFAAPNPYGTNLPPFVEQAAGAGLLGGAAGASTGTVRAWPRRPGLGR